MKLVFLVFVSLCLCLPRPSIANESEAEGDNVVELFVGGPWAEFDRYEFTLGLSYERRVNDKFGFGTVAEYTKARDLVLVVPLFFHLTHKWKLFAGPGVERAHGDYELLVRLGAAYEFELGEWSIAPELAVDFVDGETNAVAGLNFGFRF